MNAKRLLFIVLIVLLIGISTVQAEKPVNQSCVGESVSDFIDIYGGPMFGRGVSILAQDPATFEMFNLNVKNLGDAVQILQSGAIPSPVTIVIPEPPYNIVIYHTCYD